MSNAEWAKRAQAVFTPNYKPAPMVLERGEGVYVFDVEGRRYLDLVGGIAVSALGHAHPALVEAIRAQAGKILHTSNLYLNAPAIELAERLTKAGFGERVFFSNSGTEANEAAIKLSRRYQHDRGERERREVLTFEGSFHGRTYGALAATAQPKYHEGFGPMPAGFKYLPLGDVEALERAAGPATAAIMIEPLQGEGGVKLPPRGFLAACRRVADRTGALLVFDEVQVGLGRTGRVFGFQEEGVAPDILTLAKGIGGGLPLGALLTSAKIGASLAYGTHASTFGGNPVATAAGKVVLEAITAPAFLEQVRSVGEHLMRGLRAISERTGVFQEVRGRGLLIGAELSTRVPFEAKAIVDACRERAVLVHVAGPRVMRLAPPLVLGPADADRGLSAIGEAVESLLRTSPLT
jgi:acetylornithine/N-succinyldiaminopimelate aminotransferase